MPVDPGLRLVGPDDATRLGRPARRRRVEGVDGASRVRAVRRARRRLGCDHLARRSRPSTTSTSPGCTATCCWRSRPNAGELDADRGGGRRPRGGRRVHAARERVPGDPGQEPADARLRAHRFTRGARGLDRREVLRMDRPRRRPRSTPSRATRSSPTSPSTGSRNTINSSVRLYCESQRTDRFGPLGSYVKVPTAAAVFPKEMFRIPRAYAETALQPRPLHAVRSWRSLRRTRGTRPADRRHPKLLQRGCDDHARSRDQGRHRRRRHGRARAHRRRRDHRRRRHRSRSRSTARRARRSTPTARSSRPASSTCTRTSTGRSRGTRCSRRRAGTASPRS